MDFPMHMTGDVVYFDDDRGIVVFTYDRRGGFDHDVYWPETGNVGRVGDSDLISIDRYAEQVGP